MENKEKKNKYKIAAEVGKFVKKHCIPIIVAVGSPLVITLIKEGSNKD